MILTPPHIHNAATEVIRDQPYFKPGKAYSSPSGEPYRCSTYTRKEKPMKPIRTCVICGETYDDQYHFCKNGAVTAHFDFIGPTGVIGDRTVATRKEKPMKPIECPMCGKEMNYAGKQDGHVNFGCSNLDCELVRIQFRMSVFTERAARRAWNKSLIGRLRKAYKQYRKDGTLWSVSIISVLEDMFGGSDDRPGD